MYLCIHKQIANPLDFTLTSEEFSNIFKTPSEKLNELKKGKFKDFINLLELKDEEIDSATPEIIIEMTKAVDAKKLITAKLFNEAFFKNDLRPKHKLYEDNWQSINYEGKCQSSVLKSMKENTIYFNQILNSLSLYAGINLVYISFYQCFLLEDDLEYIVDIVKKYSNLLAIDLEANRMQISTQKSLLQLSAIFNSNKTILVNFNGNYCETDRQTLVHVYNSGNSAMMQGYIWIFESFLDGNGWVNLLVQFGLEKHSEMIRKSHVRYINTKNKYTKKDIWQ